MMIELVEAFLECVPNSWCSIDYGEVAKLREDATAGRDTETYADEREEPGGWMVSNCLM